MPAPGIVLAVAVVLIVAAMVYYLLSTIVALHKINKGLDTAIAGVGELIEKTVPVAAGRGRHQRQPRYRRRCARGPARQEGRSA